MDHKKRLQKLAGLLKESKEMHEQLDGDNWHPPQEPLDDTVKVMVHVKNVEWELEGEGGEDAPGAEDLPSGDFDIEVHMAEDKAHDSDHVHEAVKEALLSKYGFETIFIDFEHEVMGFVKEEKEEDSYNKLSAEDFKKMVTEMVKEELGHVKKEAHCPECGPGCDCKNCPNCDCKPCGDKEMKEQTRQDLKMVDDLGSVGNDLDSLDMFSDVDFDADDLDLDDLDLDDEDDVEELNFEQVEPSVEEEHMKKALKLHLEEMPKLVKNAVNTLDDWEASLGRVMAALRSKEKLTPELENKLLKCIEKMAKLAADIHMEQVHVGDLLEKHL